MKASFVLTFLIAAAICTVGESRKRIKRVIEPKGSKFTSDPPSHLRHGNSSHTSLHSHDPIIHHNPEKLDGSEDKTKSDVKTLEEQKLGEKSDTSDSSAVSGNIFPIFLEATNKFESEIEEAPRKDLNQVATFIANGSVAPSSEKTDSKANSVDKKANKAEISLKSKEELESGPKKDSKEGLEVMVIEEEPSCYRRPDQSKFIDPLRRWQQEQRLKSSVENAFKLTNMFLSFGLDGFPFRSQNEDFDPITYYSNMEPAPRSLSYSRSTPIQDTESLGPSEWNFIGNVMGGVVEGTGDSGSCPVHLNTKQRETIDNSETGVNPVQQSSDDRSKLIEVCSCRLMKKKNP